MAIRTQRIGMESEPLARGALDLGPTLQMAPAVGGEVVAPQRAACSLVAPALRRMKVARVFMQESSA